MGNITGSNSVNVFLGIGLPWLIGAIYWTAKTGKGMPVPARDLGFSLVIFLAVAVACIIGLAARRRFLGYELGGRLALATGVAFVGLWFLYVLLCILQEAGAITVVIGDVA